MSCLMSLRRDAAVVVVSVCAGLSIGVTGATAQLAALDDAAALERKLRLAAGDVDTSGPGVPVADAIDASRARPSKRFVLQLDGPMTPERREALEASGVVLSDYLPVNAFVADLSGANPDKVRAIGFIRWAGEFSGDWKLDPDFNRRDFSTVERQQLAQQGKSAMHLSFFPGADAAAALAEIGAIEGAQITSIRVQGDRVVAAVILDTADAPALAQFEEVQWAEEAPELTERNSTNRWIVQSNVVNVFPLYAQGIRGEGQILGIMDSAVDSAHCSFSDSSGAPIGPTHRKIVAYNTALGSVSHGTHCAGTAVGDGGTDTDTRGIAYLGKLAYNSIPAFTDADMYNRLVLHHNQGARLHTNSWGNDGTTTYDGLCRGIDRFSYDFEDSLVLFAVTNTSTLKNPENSKNCLAVGASQDTPNQGAFCSGGTGPTSDQRRKPEIYAPGCSTNSSANGTACGTRALTGTSMACPAVTGTGMLVRQYFTDGFYPSGERTPADSFVPTGALIKATLLNSAADMTGIAGFPSNQEGWGRVLADNALYFAGDTRKLVVADVRNAQGMSTGQFVDQTVNVLGSGEPLKVTLVWTDPPAAAGAGSAAINNLDLEVVAPDATAYLGNVFSGGVSVAGGTADPRNNVEMVLLNSPPAGAYTVRVRATAVNQGTQGYALVVTGDVQTAPPGLSVVLNGPLPTLVLPGSSPTISANIDPRADTLVAGSPKLHYRYGGGAFAAINLTNTIGTTWTATLPAVDCPDTPQFYVSAEGVTTGVVSDPPGGAATPKTFAVGEIQTYYAETYELLSGWTVQNDASLTSGAWELVIPIGNGSQPGEDYTPAPGVQCFLTQNGTAGQTAGSTDVDGGPTRLLSPLIDLSGISGATLSYARWFANDDGDDRLTVEISNNNGASWVTLEAITPNPSWTISSFDLGPIIPLTSQMRLRFSVADNPNNSVTDAAVDDILVTRFVCTSLPPACPGDANGDGMVGLEDIALLIQQWGTAGPEGDLDQDGLVDLPDVAIVIMHWGETCQGRASSRAEADGAAMSATP